MSWREKLHWLLMGASTIVIWAPVQPPTVPDKK